MILRCLGDHPNIRGRICRGYLGQTTAPVWFRGFVPKRTIVDPEDERVDVRLCPQCSRQSVYSLLTLEVVTAQIGAPLVDTEGCSVVK